MPAPRVTIPELPEQTTILGTELVAIQDGSTTKKLLMSKITQQDLAPRVANLESADSAFNTRVSQIETVNSGQDTAIAGLMTETGALDTRVDNHDGALTTLDTRVDGHDTTLATHTGQINTNTTGLSTLGGRVATAEGTITSLDTRVDLIEATPPSGAPIRHLVTSLGTTTVFVGASFENRFYLLTAATAVTITLPKEISISCPIGMEVAFLWYGAGQPAFVPESGATIQSRSNFRKISVRYGKVTAKKTDVNEWVLYGDLAA
jgi:hypothetical protein